MRVIISSGHGRLHLGDGATALQRAGEEVVFISHWMPGRLGQAVVRAVSAMLPGASALPGTLRARTPEGFTAAQCRSCGTSEAVLRLLFAASRVGLLSRSRAEAAGWGLYGRESLRYIVSGTDVFHVRSGAGGGGAIARARALGLKVVVDHSLPSAAFLEQALQPAYAAECIPFRLGISDPFWRLVQQDCEAADILLVNSDFVRRTFLQAGYPETRIRVAYLGVPPAYHGVKTDHAAGAPVRLLFTGAFSVRKGGAVLLRALQILDRQGFTYRLTVAGNREDAAQLCRLHPVAGPVDWLGRVPPARIPGVLAAHDLYVFPTLAEGCARSVMEALSSGLPVITTEASGAPVTHGEDGWIVPTGDSGALAAAVVALAADQELRKKLGQTAAERIGRTCTWEQYATRVRAVYREGRA